MNIAGPSPSYSGLLDSTGKMKPLRDPLREESLKICKHYLSKYLELVNRSADGSNFEILNKYQYNKLIVSLLHLWFEYNNVFSRSGYNIDTITQFGEDLIKSLTSSFTSSIDAVSVDAVSINAEKLELFKTVLSNADVGIMNLITKALKDSKDKRTLFRTQHYESPIIAKIICHFLRVYFYAYFRLLQKKMRKPADISKITDLLALLDEIITLDDNHIHIHTGVGKVWGDIGGNRTHFCDEIKIICEKLNEYGINYTTSDSVKKLCRIPVPVDVVGAPDVGSNDLGGGNRISRRRKAYKTTRRNNKHKNKKHYRRKRHTKRCKKSNRRRRSRR